MCRVNPTRQEPTSSTVDGSGTSVPSSEKAALNVGATLTLIVSTMSVPTRSQSGSSIASRVHVCRSVTPGGNGVVPAPLIGRDAESQKNCPPLVRSTCGTKKYGSGGKSNGVGKLALFCLCGPVNEPFPPVATLGAGWIPPGWTEFSAVNVALSTEDVNIS